MADSEGRPILQAVLQDPQLQAILGDDCSSLLNNLGGGGGSMITSSSNQQQQQSGVFGDSTTIAGNKNDGGTTAAADGTFLTSSAVEHIAHEHQEAIYDEIALRHRCSDLEAENARLRTLLSQSSQSSTELTRKLNLRDVVVDGLRKTVIQSQSQNARALGQPASLGFEVVDALEEELSNAVAAQVRLREASETALKIKLDRQERGLRRIISAKEREIIQLHLQFRQTLVQLRSQHTGDIQNVFEENTRLKRMAAEAEQHALIAAEMQFSIRLKSEQMRIQGECETKIAAKAIEMKYLRECLDTQEAAAKNLEEEIENLNKKLGCKERMLHHVLDVEMPHEVGKIRSQLEDYLNKEAARGQLDLANAQVEIESLQQMLVEAKETTKNASKERDEASKSLGFLKNELTHKDAQLRDMQSKNNVLNQTITALERDAEQTAAEIQIMRRMQQQLEDASHTHHNLSSSLSASSNSPTTGTTELAEIRRQLLVSQDDNTSLKNDVNVLQEQLMKTKDDVKSQSTTRSILQSRVSELEKLLQDQMAQSKAALDKADKQLKAASEAGAAAGSSSAVRRIGSRVGFLGDTSAGGGGGSKGPGAQSNQTSAATAAATGGGGGLKPTGSFRRQGSGVRRGSATTLKPGGDKTTTTTTTPSSSQIGGSSTVSSTTPTDSTTTASDSRRPSSSIFGDVVDTTSGGGPSKVESITTSPTSTAVAGGGDQTATTTTSTTPEPDTGDRTTTTTTTTATHKPYDPFADIGGKVEESEAHFDDHDDEHQHQQQQQQQQQQPSSPHYRGNVRHVGIQCARLVDRLGSLTPSMMGSGILLGGGKRTPSGIIIPSTTSSSGQQQLEPPGPVSGFPATLLTSSSSSSKPDSPHPGITSTGRVDSLISQQQQQQQTRPDSSSSSSQQQPPSAVTRPLSGGDDKSPEPHFHGDVDDRDHDHHIASSIYDGGDKKFDEVEILPDEELTDFGVGASLEERITNARLRIELVQIYFEVQHLCPVKFIAQSQQVISQQWSLVEEQEIQLSAETIIAQNDLFEKELEKRRMFHALLFPTNSRCARFPYRADPDATAHEAFSGELDLYRNQMLGSSASAASQNFADSNISNVDGIDRRKTETPFRLQELQNNVNNNTYNYNAADQYDIRAGDDLDAIRRDYIASAVALSRVPGGLEILRVPISNLIRPGSASKTIDASGSGSQYDNNSVDLVLSPQIRGAGFRGIAPPRPFSSSNSSTAPTTPRGGFATSQRTKSNQQPQIPTDTNSVRSTWQAPQGFLGVEPANVPSQSHFTTNSGILAPRPPNSLHWENSAGAHSGTSSQNISGSGRPTSAAYVNKSSTNLDVTAILADKTFEHEQKQQAQEVKQRRSREFSTVMKQRLDPSYQNGKEIASARPSSARPALKRAFPSSN